MHITLIHTEYLRSRDMKLNRLSGSSSQQSIKTLKSFLGRSGGRGEQREALLGAWLDPSEHDSLYMRPFEGSRTGWRLVARNKSFYMPHWPREEAGPNCNTLFGNSSTTKEERLLGLTYGVLH